jgi:hypothetical protein
MAARIDLTGKEFKNLKVVDRAPNRITPKGQQRTTWNCVCICGKEFTAESQHIRNNPNISCGCKNLQRPLLREEVKIGETYSRLTITKGEHFIENRRYVVANCSCGKTDFLTRAESVLDGNTQSCGCLQREAASSVNKTHGESKTTLYKNYHAMLARCYDSNALIYENYGARGITVCDRWLGKDGYLNFKEDMGEKPRGFSIERKDVNGNYCPENCVWECGSVQGFNRRKLKLNTSGRTGVYWYKSRNHWVSKLMKDGKEHWIGQYISFEDACKAVETAEIELFGFSRTDYCFNDNNQ